MRLWSYDTSQEAIDECIGLSKGMTSKHEVFHTGFNGAKLVVDAPDPANIDKKALMDATADALHQLNGTIYTGQDLNTSEEDMAYLSSLAPYVLAGLESSVDTNVATGYGVFGALQGLTDGIGGVAGKTFLVHGTGKVGGVVAKLLARYGAHVLTYDVFPEAADIPHCTNVSSEEWRDLDFDVLVPCSVSGLLDEDTVQRVKCGSICGASNLPFATSKARDMAMERGLLFVPESITSAGAVIIDSIEAFDRPSFISSRPHETYSFVRGLVREKTGAVLQHAGRKASRVNAAIEEVAEEAARERPAGLRFKTWIEENKEVIDRLVVGDGIAGAMAAWRIAKAEPDTRVAVLEPIEEEDFPIGETWGAGQPITGAPPDVKKQCNELWRELEAASSHNIRSGSEAVIRISLEGEHNEGNEESITPEEASRVLGMSLPQGMRASKFTNGEVIDDDGMGAMKALREVAESAGARFVDAEAVADIRLLGDKARIVTSRGRVIEANSVFVAAGACSESVLEKAGKVADVKGPRVVWAKYAKGEMEAEPLGYKWVWDNGATRFFGKTPREGEEVMEVAVETEAPQEEALGRLDEFVRGHFPGVGDRVRAAIGGPSSQAPCLGSCEGADGFVVVSSSSPDMALVGGEWLALRAESGEAPESAGQVELASSDPVIPTY